MVSQPKTTNLYAQAGIDDLARFYRERFFTNGVLDARYFDPINRFDIRFARTMWVYDNVRPHSSVLDLGCGDGELLSLLKTKKNCRVTGIEIDEQAIFKCLERGVTVSQGDIDSGLTDYSDKRFDYVILNESLQEVLNPEHVILEACRVGKKVIVGIPNFCNITARFQVFFQGLLVIE